MFLSFICINSFLKKINMQIEKSLKFNKTFSEHTIVEEAKELLCQFLNANLYDIHDMLFSYHYAKRERVYDIIIEKSDIIYSEGKGYFTVKYMIGFFNACADLNFNDKEKMKITYNIDFVKDEIVLKGEYIPEEEQHEI